MTFFTFERKNLARNFLYGWVKAGKFVFFTSAGILSPMRTGPFSGKLHRPLLTILQPYDFC
jgi:hypothetical protein